MTSRAHEPGTFLFDAASSPDVDRALTRAERYCPCDVDTAAFRAAHDWRTRFEQAALFDDVPDAIVAAPASVTPQRA
jgi:hypothetical protein